MNISEHLLTTLGEEGCEVAQDCSKALRFGLDDRNVLNPTGPTNRERIVAELNDLFAVVSILVNKGILPGDWSCPDAQTAKVLKVEKFIEYAVGTGALTK